jgi:hypothetical protein
MSAVAVARRGRVVSIQRARVFGILFVVLAGAIVWWFGLGSESGVDATFGLDAPDTFVSVPDLVLPARGTSFVLAAVCAFLGGVQLTRGFGRRTYLVLGVVVACFIFAFLAWAARGDSMNLLGMLESTVLRAVPLTLGALSGVLCERSGVINIAIEGMMLSAAFTGAIVASAASNLSSACSRSAIESTRSSPEP